MITKIEWATDSWNPVTGCTPISEGCQHCYAKRMARRLAGRYGYPKAPHHFDVTLHPDRLEQPLKWKKPRRIFVCSMGDLFHEDVPLKFIGQVWRRMRHCPQHTFIVLTKRAERMSLILSNFMRGHSVSDNGRPLPNVIGMVTAENQKRAEERIPWLLKTPFARWGVSLEPLLEPVDIQPYLPQLCAIHLEYHRDGRNCLTRQERYGLNGIIVGGESGPGARPMHPDWVRSVRDQCVAAGVPFFFKGWGAWCPYDVERHENQLAGWMGKPNWEVVRDQYIRFMHTSGSFDPTYKETATMIRVGKKAAGRMLDGRLWEEYPR